MERLTDKRMKGEGFIPVDHKEYKAILREEKPTAKQIYRRLLEIEDILGDDYDLEPLSVMMNQCMSMRDEVQERFRLTANIPLDQLKELVELVKNIPHVCKFCAGCEMEPKDGHGCDEYDSFVFSTRRLRELVKSDSEGRCMVLPQKTVFELTWDAGPGCDLICPISIDGEDQCESCPHGELFVYERECKPEHLDRIGKDVFLTRETAKKEKLIREQTETEWEINTDEFTPKKRCVVCGYNKPIPAGENLAPEPEKYCPNCGAKKRIAQPGGKVIKK